MNKTIVSVLCLLVVCLSALLVHEYLNPTISRVCFGDELHIQANNALTVAMLKWPMLQEDEFTLHFLPSNY